MAKSCRLQHRYRCVAGGCRQPNAAYSASWPPSAAGRARGIEAHVWRTQVPGCSTCEGLLTGAAVVRAREVMHWKDRWTHRVDGCVAHRTWMRPHPSLEVGWAEARHAPASSMPACVPLDDAGRTQGPVLRRRLAALTYCGSRERGEPKSSLVKATHPGTKARRGCGPLGLRGLIGHGFMAELGWEVRQWRWGRARLLFFPRMLCGRLMWRGRLHLGGGSRPARHIHAGRQ